MRFQINSVDDAIDALGGTGETARFFGVDSRVVSNWRMRKKIPPDVYLAFTQELKRRRMTADPALFGQKMPACA